MFLYCVSRIIRVHFATPLLPCTSLIELIIIENTLETAPCLLELQIVSE